ncbi:Z-ring formation inhibitor MciZ [Paenibacillus roseipurpureus]|uniref:Z-ring formation inhibitor MciZ n=1 Tax=Paenibacillus roseopurpureus TaxID=2918901 RepID=A0AA96LIX8_9BACL|nr:Z-ring formation inhibitor MciZ [Paenibacillus sp. MBLB1832]WNR42525.1 Z-ring formation inhibitor MciZ [Paenibacillus sp. MBLB1832]
MKRYVSGGQLRLVGKAWEIKLQLHQLIHQHGKTTTLSDYLQRSVQSPQLRTQGVASGAHLVPFPVK